MLIPVRCFTCNKVIGHKWNTYKDKVAENLDSGMSEMDAQNQALNDVGLPPIKYCCRRMLTSHVDVIDNLLLYSNNPGEKSAPIKYMDALPEDYEEPLPQADEEDEDDIEDDEEDDVDEEENVDDDDDEEEDCEYSDDDDEGGQDYTFIGVGEDDDD